MLAFEFVQICLLDLFLQLIFMISIFSDFFLNFVLFHFFVYCLRLVDCFLFSFWFGKDRRFLQSSSSTPWWPLINMILLKMFSFFRDIYGGSFSLVMLTIISLNFDYLKLVYISMSSLNILPWQKIIHFQLFFSALLEYFCFVTVLPSV